MAVVIVDPAPSLPPRPFLNLPFGLFAGTTCGVLLVCLLGATVVHRRADRADPASLMRMA